MHISRRKALSLAGSLIAIVLAGSCASTPRAQETLQVYVSMLRVLPEVGGQRPYGVTLLLRNSDIDPVELGSIDFSIRLGPGGFLDGTIDVPTTVPALDDVSVTATVSGEFVPSVASLLGFLQGAESALPYELEGTAWLDTRPRRELHFEREGRVPLAMSAVP